MTRQHFGVTDLAVELDAYAEIGLGARPVVILTEDGRRFEVIDIYRDVEAVEILIEVRAVNPG